MDLNKIKLLGQKELLQRLIQSGYSDLAMILEDKDVDGERFIALKEFETFKWRLAPSQKKILWSCINEIKANPSLLVSKNKPKPLNKKPAVERNPTASEIPGPNAIKMKLEGLLNPAGPAERLPNRQRPAPPPPAVTAPPNQIGTSRPTPPVFREPAPLPRDKESPLPSGETTTKRVVRKPVLPLPAENETVEDYMDMQPPSMSQADDKEDDGYLTPTKLGEDHYEAPPVYNNSNVFRYLKSGNSAVNIPPPPTLPGTSTNNGKAFNSSSIPKRQPAVVGEAEELDYEQVSKCSPVFPMAKGVATGNINNNNQSTVTRKSAVNINSRDAASLSSEVDRRVHPAGQMPPPLKPRTTLINFNTDESNKITTTEEQKEPLPRPVVRKQTVKDLSNVLIITDKEGFEPPVIFSKITTTLSNIFRKNKPKYTYENHTIAQSYAPPKRSFAIKDRPLPSIPPMSLDTKGKKPPDDFFEKPFPLPRTNIPSVNLQSYIEPDNSEPVRRQVAPAPSFREAEETSDEGQVYENSVKVDERRTEPRETSPFSGNVRYIEPKRDSYLHKQILQARTAQEESSEEEEEVYENTAKAQEETEEEDDQVYENTAKNSKEDSLTKPGNPRYPRIQISNSSQTRSNFAINANVSDTEYGNVIEQPTRQISVQDKLALLLNQQLREREKNAQLETESREGGNSPRRSPVPSNSKDEENSDYSNTDASASILLSMKNKPYKSKSPTRPRPSTIENDESSTPRDDISKIPVFQRPLPAIPRDDKATIKTQKSPTNYRRKVSPSSDDRDEQITYGNTLDKLPLVIPKTSANKPPRRDLLNDGSTGTVPKRVPNYEEYTMDSESIGYFSQSNQSDSLEDDEDQHYHTGIFNINDEPFYRNTDRKGAKQLLRGLEDGAFLLRPSEAYFLVLTIKYKNKFYNLGVERTSNNRIRLSAEGDGMSPDFATLRDFVNHFISEPVTFQENKSVVEINLKCVLPSDRF